MRKTNAPQARVTLHVAGVHCPSCVDHITRLLEGPHRLRVSAAAAAAAAVSDVVASFLEHTVTMTVMADRGNSDKYGVHVLKETLAPIVAYLSEEGYAPSAIEVRWLGAPYSSDYSTTTQVMTLDTSNRALSGGDGVDSSPHRLLRSAQAVSPWHMIAHPFQARKEIRLRRLEDARWKRHLIGCKVCREIGNSGNSVRDDQQRSSSSHSNPRPPSGNNGDASIGSGGSVTVDVAISGMTCAACVGTVERAVQSLDLANSINVNLLDSSARATLEDRRGVDDLIRAIEDAGYDAKVLRMQQTEKKKRRPSALRKTTACKSRAQYSIHGLTCAACVNIVQRAVQAVTLPPSFVLDDFRTNLLQSTASATVSVPTDTGEDGVKSYLDLLTQAIEEAGYDAVLERFEITATAESSNAGAEQPRYASIAVDGMFCGQCLLKVKALLDRHIAAGDITLEKGYHQDQATELSLAHTKLELCIPSQSSFRLRDLLAEIDSLDPAFEARLIKPISPATQSAQRARRELIAMLVRLLFAFLFVPPTLLVAVIVPTFLAEAHPLRVSLENNIVGHATKGDFVLLALATPVQFAVGSLFHTRALKSLRAVWRRKRAWTDRFIRWGDMNVLVSLGTMVAYFASLAFLIVDALADVGSLSSPKTESNGSSMLYFDACVFLVFFILLGRVLEAASKRSTTSAIDALGALRPTTGILLEDQTLGSTKTVDIDLLDIHDLVLVPSGASPPLDAELVGHLGDKARANEEGAAADAGALQATRPNAIIDIATFSESAISGEARPVTKRVGDAVFAGTANQSPHAIIARVTARAGSCVIDGVVDAVRSAGSAGQKASLERLADRLTAHFVPAIVAASILVLVIWLIVLFSGAVSDDWVRQHASRASSSGGDSLAEAKILYAIQFAVSCLVIACPCGIGLAAPTAHVVAIGLASKHGILVQGGGQAFEMAVKFATASRAGFLRCLLRKGHDHHHLGGGRKSAFVFDKTGTLTTGSDGQVTQSKLFATDRSATDGPDSWSDQLILLAVQKVEASSTHPVGAAIGLWCRERLADAELDSGQIDIVTIDEFAGRGLRTRVRKTDCDAEAYVYIGSQRLVKEEMQSLLTLVPDTKATAEAWQDAGGSVVYIAIQYLDCPSAAAAFSPPLARLVALLSVSDPERPEAESVVRHLTSNRAACWIVSGDAPRTTHAVANRIGIASSHVVAGVLPTDKADWVARIRRLPSTEPMSQVDVEKLAAAVSHDDQGKAAMAEKAKHTDSLGCLIAFIGDGINDAPALAAADMSIALGSGSTLAQSSASFVLMGGGDASSSRPLLALPVLLSLSRATHNKVWQNLAWACVFNGVCLPMAAGVLVPAGFTLGPSWSGLAMALSSTAVVLNALALRLWRPPLLVA